VPPVYVPPVYTPVDTTTTPVTTTTTGGNAAVVTESGKVTDPDLGLDISAGKRPALATALLLIPLLLAALL
jgi:hypothetical protein